MDASARCLPALVTTTRPCMALATIRSSDQGCARRSAHRCRGVVGYSDQLPRFSPSSSTMGWPGVSFSSSASPGCVCVRRCAACSADVRCDPRSTDCSTSPTFAYDTGGIAFNARTVSWSAPDRVARRTKSSLPLGKSASDNACLPRPASVVAITRTSSAHSGFAAPTGPTTGRVLARQYPSTGQTNSVGSRSSALRMQRASTPAPRWLDGSTSHARMLPENRRSQEETQWPAALSKP